MRPHDIDANTWAELSALLDTALDLPQRERAQWIATLGPDKDAVKGFLLDLLSHEGAIETADFLDALPSVEIGPLAFPEAAYDQASPGDTVGPYRLLKELGTGGMGVVWLAERSDGLINRQIALKFPHLTCARKDLAERMAHERDILATLEHLNIARLYDAGLTREGQPYLALEYVEGQPIDAYCAARQLSVPERLKLFVQIAQAVAYAHAKLIVHRDLKPANVLVTQSGEVRLLDFGIAKLLDDGVALETRLTELSGRAFTLDYASPEQIAGAPITTSSDIYSLGVILYELLSGQRPYKLKRNSRGALEEAILEIDVRPPSEVVDDRSVRKRMRGDLDTIILKALKKRPEDRYATMNALVEDVERYLSNRPVLARPDAASYRIGKFVGRNALAVAASAAVLMAIVIGAGVAIWQARVALAEKESADAVREFIVSIFRDADPYGRSGQASTGADLLRRAQTDIQDRFEDRPDLKIDLLNIVGSGLLSLEDLPAAESAFRRAIDASTRLFGPLNARTLEARALMTELHSARSDRELMKTELQELIPLSRSVVRSHPEVLVRLLKNRANLAFEEGRFADMQSAAREAFELSMRELGRHHAMTLATSALLSQSFVIGSYPSDVVLRETQRAVDLALEAHGGRDDHPSVIRVREHRGRALAVTGHFHEAVAEMRKASKGLDAVFGSSSRVAAYAALNLAPWERRVGEVQLSLNRTNAAMQALEGLIDKDSMDYAFALTTRGVTLVSARRSEEALRDLSAAEATYRRILGDEHWDTLTAQFNRAVALAYLRRFAEADEALAPLRNPSTPIARRDWALHVAGIVERKRGDWDEAIAKQRAAEQAIQEGPRADWDRVRVVAELGLALAARGDDEEAAKTLTAARDLFIKLKATMYPDYADVLVALGRLRLRQRDDAAAFSLLTAADSFWREFDPDNRFAAEAALWLVRAYEQRDGDRG